MHPGRGSQGQPLVTGGSDACDEPAPEEHAGPLSRYTFWWTYPSIKASNESGKMMSEHLPALPKADSPAGLFQRCSACLRGSRGESPRLVWTMYWRTQRWRFLTSFLHGWSFLFLMTIDPLLLNVLLDSTQDAASKQTVSNLMLVVTLSLSMLVRVSFMEFCYFHSQRLANNIRSMLVHLIFRKALAIPDHQLNPGKVVNLMGTDADKLGCYEWIIFALAQWSWAILSLPVVMFFLYRLVGVGALVCTIVLISSSWVNKILSGYISRRTKELQEARDLRAKLMHEVIRGIRTVKLQALEDLWLERVEEARSREMRALVRVRIYGALNNLLGSLVSTATPVSIFATVTLIEQRALDPTTAFTALAWISTLRWTVSSLPGAYNTVADLKPSLDRISRFLSLPAAGGEAAPEPQADVELASMGPGATRRAAGVVQWQQESWLKSWREEVNGYGPPAAPGEPAVDVRSATFGHLRRASADDAEGQQPSQDVAVLQEAEPSRTVVLQDVSMQIDAGKLVMIAGPVGAGKSTLLASLACARPALAGHVTTRGRRSYVAQKPFLLNATVRENILFGLPFESSRYQEVIWRAALDDDLKALSLGDQTPVGESGVQLSGGQKARVALARAMYTDADVALLDDVLSAVDAHTGRHLWEHCIVKGLKGRGRTVVLVSHQLQYLSMPEVDSVLLLRGGRLELQGPWEEIKKLRGKSDELLSFVRDREEHEEGANEESVEEPAPAEESAAAPEESHAHRVSVSLAECQAAVARTLGTVRGRRVDARLVEVVCQTLGGESEAVETMREGGITWLDFKEYLNVFGSWLTISLAFALLVAGALFEVASNVWLSVWTSSTQKTQQEEERNLIIYTLISMGGGFVGCAQALILTICSLQASRAIHGRMLKRLLGAPMSFFDSSPTGRVMNRFLQDLWQVDQAVPQAISDQTARTLNIVTQLSLIYIEAPLVLATLPLLLVPYGMIFTRMRVPNRDARRIESAAHSPVYAHFSDTLMGRETVRAFGAEARFEQENLRHIFVMSQAKYATGAVSKWAQIVTTQWGCALYFFSGVACVLLSSAGDMSASQVGLVLLYAGNLQRAAMDYMMNTANLEKQFVSVERVAEYMRLEAEEGSGAADLAVALRRQTSAGAPLEGWPHAADVCLRAVSLRYQLYRPLVLSEVDLQVPSRAKVALCGRTGCGKSTLFAALSRLYPLVGGQVTIGGRDITAVPLKDLRAHVRVVSQDAFLVSGSLRRNLAMQDEAAVADEVLWHVLKVVGMDAKVQSMDGGLESMVEEGGQNFSVGERQLLALARVLVPRACASLDAWAPPRILLCDEATASVDLAADERVHDVLLELPTTVLMICHRLQHIRRFQLVVVMDMGRVAEMGDPSVLLADVPTSSGGGSRLARLCAEAGVA